MFFGSTLMEWLTPGAFHEIGYLKTTDLALSNADANSPTAVIKVGKMMDIKDNSETEMKYGSGAAIGILTRPVSLNGTKTDEWFKKLTVGGFIDAPVTRGQCVTLQCPHEGAQAIFEGQADISGGNGPAIDELVIKTGTGALSGASTIGSELSVLNGAWRLAQVGDWVIGRLLQANITPVVAGGIRIRLEFVNKYKKSA